MVNISLGRFREQARMYAKRYKSGSPLDKWVFEQFVAIGAQHGLHGDPERVHRILTEGK